MNSSTRSSVIFCDAPERGASLKPLRGANMRTMSECIGCHEILTYNPNRVSPIRRTCVIANGLEPIVVLPRAYQAEDVS